MTRRNVFNLTKKNSIQTFKKSASLFSSTELQQSIYNQNLKKEKDLLFKVLKTMPSKREANVFINRYIPDQVSVINSATTYPIALITISTTMMKKEIKEVIKNLAYIYRLGLHPIIVLENINWSNLDNHTNFNYMIQDGLSLCQLIESENISTRFIPNGIFTTTNPIITQYQHLPIIDTQVHIDPIVSALTFNSIPVLLPISSDSKSCYNKKSIFEIMTALSRSFSRYKDVECKIKNKDIDVNKVIIVNSTGGIPHLKKKNNIINFINLQQDLPNFIPETQDQNFSEVVATKSNWERDLLISYGCLAFLPATSSAVILDTKSINSVISNLITDKPMISPSLPNIKLDKNVTILRYGLKLTEYKTMNTINLEKLRQLLEESFGKSLNKNYFLRLEKNLNRIIIAGDFQGAVITTKENDFLYLDKFSVSLKSQGIGVADVLWQRLMELKSESNFNLIWRSRCNNGVNKWYFQRSIGSFKIPESKWSLFWSGEIDSCKLIKYTNIVNDIPQSFQ